jgi:hypothetical protein
MVSCEWLLDATFFLDKKVPKIFNILISKASSGENPDKLVSLGQWSELPNNKWF